MITNKVILKNKLTTLVNAGRIDEAESLLEKWEEIFPNDLEFVSVKMTIDIMKTDIEKAEALARQVIVQGCKDPDVFFNLAYICEMTGRVNESVELYIKARSLYESNDEARSEIDNALARISEGAEQELSEAQKWHIQAIMHEKNGNNTEAALCYGLSFKHSSNKGDIGPAAMLYTPGSVLAEIFEAAAKSQRRKFIILSSCGWGDILQRPHHIARSLAKFGHEIHYITPGVRASLVNPNISISALTNYALNNMRTIDGVMVYDPIRVYQNDKLISNNYIDLVQSILSLPSNDDNPIFVTYMPYQVDVLKAVQGKYFHIYECVDDHTDLEHAFWGHRNDVEWEQQLMECADAITTTATSLFLQRLSIERRGNVYLSRNAVDETDFNSEPESIIPKDLVDIPEPRIVYTGAVYEWFDEKLFNQVVESNPDKSFVVIGPVQEGKLSRKYPNLYLLGVKKHSELKCYLRHMQLGIIPFKSDADICVACDPIKQHEYIACGLPVITSFLPEGMIGKVYTSYANTKERFNYCIEKCLANHIDEKVKVGFLQENSWLARAALLIRIASKMISEDERQRTIAGIGKELTDLANEYDEPIITALRGLYENLSDEAAFVKLTRQAYNRQRSKYIERLYLTALLKNGRTRDFVNVVADSRYIDKQVGKQLRTYAKSWEWDRLLIDLRNKDVRLLYIDPDRFFHVPSIDAPYICIANLFDSMPIEFVNLLTKNGVYPTGICTQSAKAWEGVETISLEQLAAKQAASQITVIVPYDMNYVKQVRNLAENKILECYVAVLFNGALKLVHIDNALMGRVRERKYNKTITFNKFNAADSNIHALLEYMPDEYRSKYEFNVIYGKDVWDINNIVKVPLMSNVTVSGFATFLYNYPKLTYNIEVGHGGLQLKACGNMDKKQKNSGGDPSIFAKADCVCVASHLNMMVFSAFYAIPEDKYEITGLPRNDVMVTVNGKANLERLLGICLEGKKVVFNMPTFHIVDSTQRIEGASNFNDSFKLSPFDYDEFDRFLADNNSICVSKVHHGEELSVTKKTKDRVYNNLFFITNADLEERGLDLYEILGAGDVLITDYSTVYNDFMFMDKPIVFLNADIEEYREQRGLALEPYDFWTAGPKVQTQADLQEELRKCLFNKDYYHDQRERLRPIFFKYSDTQSIQRTWRVIEKAVEKFC